MKQIETDSNDTNTGTNRADTGIMMMMTMKNMMRERAISTAWNQKSRVLWRIISSPPAPASPPDGQSREWPAPLDFLSTVFLAWKCLVEQLWRDSPLPKFKGGIWDHYNLYLELVKVLLLDVRKEDDDFFRCNAEKMTERNLKSCNRMWKAFFRCSISSEA